MATKRFCDICDTQLTAADDIPFVRELSYIPLSPGGDRVWPANEPEPKAVAYVAITNEENHPLTDVCSECKLHIVRDGIAPEPKTVATLQPTVAQDNQVPVALFALPKTPPTVPVRRPPAQQEEPVRYEPSLPIHQSDQ